jgi:hypothetical protein
MRWTLEIRIFNSEENRSAERVYPISPQLEIRIVLSSKEGTAIKSKRHHAFQSEFDYHPDQV